jgi:hypothetical protein
MPVIVHLLEYRVVPGHEAELVSYVCNSVLGEPGQDGVMSRCVGRRLSREVPRYVALTEWEGWGAFVAGTDGSGIPGYLAPVRDLLLGPSSHLYRVVASAGVDGVEARILRVYRARVPAGQLDDWEVLARKAARALTEKAGMLRVEAGIGFEDPHRPDGVEIAAVTAWRDWQSVVAATGGHLHHLLQDTEIVDVEQTLQADHYQLLGPEPLPLGRTAGAAVSTRAAGSPIRLGRGAEP